MRPTPCGERRIMDSPRETWSNWQDSLGLMERDMGYELLAIKG